MLDIRNIDVYRSETQVLWDVSMAVATGERVAILGSNGAGKSTLLDAITGVLVPRNGDIRFNDRSLLGKKPYEIIQLGISVVPEGRRVYPDMTVFENLEVGAYCKRGRSELAQTMKRVFNLFPVLQKRKGQRAVTLSGGEQQMLSIGRALMSRPELLIIDELSLGLAPLLTTQIYQALSGLGEEFTVVLVEQNVEKALQHSERAYVLESGRIASHGLSCELIRNSDIRRAYLGL
ncbi:MAG: ABC transporter ATP-binding protein [Deltaproteobacteria bacterium]|nr:ABC transporter ATP-binding protein [Deltaproteobacteria bacterium]